MAAITALGRKSTASSLASLTRSYFHASHISLHPPMLLNSTCLPYLRRAFSLYNRVNVIDKVPDNQLRLPSLRRAFSLYDQINLIDKIPEGHLRFRGYSESGFTVNGVDYEGSVLIADNTIMTWSPRKFSEITADSLSIFQILRPTPEILILGCGKYIQNLNPDIRSFIKSIGMKVEVIDSRNAASTFNILNEEGRMVAAALLPYGVSS